MTYCGSRGFGLSVTLVVAVLIALVSVVLSTEGVDATTTDMYGDWAITNRTVTLVNETVDVRWNVTVGDGGLLVLVNTTLIVNVTSSEDGLLVDHGGSLRSINSTILGNRTGSRVIIRGDTVLRGTTINWFQGDSNHPGVVLEDGNVEISDSTIWVAVQAWTDVVFENAMIYGSITLVYNHPSIERNIRWEIRDLEKRDWGTYMLIRQGNGSGYKVDAYIENLTFVGLHYAFTVVVSEGLNLTVLGCRFIDNDHCFLVSEGNGGTARFFDNTMRRSSDISGWSSGFHIRVVGRSNLTFVGNMVEGFHAAYYIESKQETPATYKIGNLSAKGCFYSIYALSSHWENPAAFHVEVHNSTFESMLWGFKVGYITSITVYDTIHQPGFGWVDPDGGHIRAYARLDIQEVWWKDGPVIGKGDLDLHDEDGALLMSRDLERLEPVVILGWDYWEGPHVLYQYLTPSTVLVDHRYYGDPIDIWGPMPVSILLVDDVNPEVQISYPAQEHYHKEDHVVAVGTYSEFGSGLAGLSYVIDSSDPIDLLDFSGRGWTQPVSDLAEGLHTLKVKAVDKVGNSVTTGTVYFTIDTQRPTIELDGIPTVVNVPTLNFTGRTEPFVSVMVNGLEHFVEHDGEFHLVLHLREGPNDILIWVTDRAGNVNSTTLCVVLDTIPPDLAVTSPWNGTWITARTVLVEGMTENDAILTIDGEMVPHSGGRFRQSVELAHGEFHLYIVVSDHANNAITRVLVLLVDWTAPRILIESPEGSPSFTSLASMDILGVVEDENLDTVLIDGVEATVLDGTFLGRCELEEGRNVIAISAEDVAGNLNTTTLIIVRDIEIPGYSVELSLDDGELVRRGATYHSPSPTLRLDINAIEPVIIELDGHTYGPQDKIRVALLLDEGRNDIAVSVRDRAGNLAQPYETVVVVDTVPPPLTGVRPPSGTKTKEESITISGWTEPGVRLTINGIHYSVRSDGLFVEGLEIGTGVNVFDVTVTDLVGNSSNVTILIIGEEPDGVFRVGAVQYGLVLVLAAGAMFIVGVKVLRSKQEKDVT